VLLFEVGDGVIPAADDEADLALVRFTTKDSREAAECLQIQRGVSPTLLVDRSADLVDQRYEDDDRRRFARRTCAECLSYVFGLIASAFCTVSLSAPKVAVKGVSE